MQDKKGERKAGRLAFLLHGFPFLHTYPEPTRAEAPHWTLPGLPSPGEMIMIL